jgi:hypothetical protein
MTDIQFLIVVGTIWIATHSNKWYGLFVGFSLISLAVLNGLGWL